MWLDELINSIDAKNWNEIQGLAWMNPTSFFDCFNVRGCRKIGKNRLQWLMTTCQARLDARQAIYATEFETLVIRAIKVGLKIPDVE